MEKASPSRLRRIELPSTTYVDPISKVSGGLTLGRGVLQFLDYVRGVREARVISALFDPEGNRIDGDERIRVIRHPGASPSQWWYQVEAIEDHTFVRLPVIDSDGFEEQIATETGQPNPDARYWRWIQRIPSGSIAGAGG